MTGFTSNSHSLIQTEMWALTTKTILQNKKKLSLEEMDLTMDIFAVLMNVKHAAIKQAKQIKLNGGQYLKFKYEKAWQVD